MIMALEWCVGHVGRDESIEIYSDSRLVVMQASKKFKINSPSLLELNKRLAELAGNFKEVKFINVRRTNENIARVDKALNIFLDEKSEKRS